MSTRADRAGAGHGSRAKARRVRSRAAALLRAGGIADAAPAAPAAHPRLPSFSTGSAHNVSFASATVSGSVNPNGRETSYYFQYGVTRAYRGQTAGAPPGG